MPARFSLDTRVKQSGEQVIRVSWTCGNVRHQPTIGYSVKKANWDALRNQVVPGTNNSDGVHAEDINTYLSRLYRVSLAVERTFKSQRKPLTKAIMKGVFSDALSNNFSSVQDIADKWVSGTYTAIPIRTSYYKYYNGVYYRKICKAYHETLKADLIILQELFGLNRIIALPTSSFSISKSKDKIEDGYYKEVTEEEALKRW